jgi:hypothetical protein
MALGRTVQQSLADTLAQFNLGMTSVPGTNTAALLIQDRDLLRSAMSGSAWGNKTVTIQSYVFFHLTLSDYATRRL